MFQDIFWPINLILLKRYHYNFDKLSYFKEESGCLFQSISKSELSIAIIRLTFDRFQIAIYQTLSSSMNI